MRLLINIILLAVCIQDIHAQILEKKISIEANHTSIEEILNILSANHSITFSYRTDYISLDKRVSINRINTSIAAILDEVFLHQSIDYKVIGNIVVLKKRNAIASKTTLNKELFNANPLSSNTIKRNSKEKIATIQSSQNSPIDSIRSSALIASQSPTIVEKTNRDSVSKNNNIVVLEKSVRREEVDYRMVRMIVQKAFGQIENNFHTEPLLFKGYYREIIEENKQAIAVIDAAIDIYDKGYKIKSNVKKPREKIMLRGVRSSNFEIKEAFRADFLKFNSLSAILRWNKIKYRTQEAKDIIGTSRYKIDSLIKSPTEMTYVVSTLIASQTHELVITYHIDALTHSFVKAMYNDKAKNGYYLNQKWQFSDNRSYYFQAKQTLLIYEFERYQEKMYLSQYTEKSYADIYNKKSKAIEWEFGCARKLRITDVIPWQSKSKSSEAMDDSKALSEQVTPHNSVLWEGFDMQKLLPLSERQLQKLESETTLLQQFQENALNKD